MNDVPGDQLWNPHRAAAAITTWNYDPYRGFLSSKTYDGGVPGPSYTYTAAGRLLTRTWARGVTTAYSYNAAGDLTHVSYSDSTPGVAYACDRQGRQSTIAWNGITETLAYNLAGQRVSESWSAGLLAGLAITNSYDADLRRATLAVRSGAMPLLQQSFTYDAASRLQTVSGGNGTSAVYSYVDNASLVSQITFKQGGTTRMTTSRQYDYLNRLTSISSQPGAAGVPPVSFNYQYNAANQRV